MDHKILRFWFHRSHLYITIGIFLFSVFVIYLPLNTSFFDPVTRAFNDFRLSDLFLRLSDRESKPESNEIFVVDVTTIRNRTALASVVTEVAQTLPNVIGLDIIFPEDDRLEENLDLFNAVDMLSVPLVAAYEVLEDQSLFSSYFVDGSSIREGYTNTTKNNTYSQCLRTYTTTLFINRDTLYSFPLQIAGTYKPDLKYKPEQESLINFSDINIRVISPDEISQYADRFRNKIVIIGIASGKEDLHLTPIGDLSGPEIVAFSLYTLIHHREIEEMSPWLGCLLAFILTYFFVVGCSYLHLHYEKTDNIRITLMGILVTLILVFINLLVNHLWLYNINFVYTFVGIVLAGDALSFYVGWQMWLNEKGKLKHPEKALYI